ncbi:hypothetical protein NSQ89_01105 [Niallia sp. FSL R7-0648]|uniref:hypothetical protein n=1 Tax=unclassified Niallia TaxID=2837522 RepID=UPI0030F6AE9A
MESSKNNNTSSSFDINVLEKSETITTFANENEGSGGGNACCCVGCVSCTNG